MEWQVTFNRELSVQDNVDSSDEEDTNPPLVKGRKTSGIISFAAEGSSSFRSPANVTRLTVVLSELSRPCSTKIDSTEIRILKAFHFSSVPAHTGASFPSKFYSHWTKAANENVWMNS